MTQIIGLHAIEEALLAGTKIEKLLISTDKKITPPIKALQKNAASAGIKIQKKPKRFLDNLTQNANHQGLIAIPITQNKTKQTLDDILKEPEDCVLILDHIQDPHNFGAILRSAEALGIKTTIYPKDRAARVTLGTTKSSAGATEHINLIQVANLSDTIQKLKKSGYWIYAADSNKGTTLPKFTPNKPFALLAGNESQGISPGLQKLIDENIEIPLKGNLNSLNVSVATAILLYQLNN